MKSLKEPLVEMLEALSTTTLSAIAYMLSLRVMYVFVKVCLLITIISAALEVAADLNYFEFIKAQPRSAFWSDYFASILSFEFVEQIWSTLYFIYSPLLCILFVAAFFSTAFSRISQNNYASMSPVGAVTIAEHTVHPRSNAAKK